MRSAGALAWVVVLAHCAPSAVVVASKFCGQCTPIDGQIVNGKLDLAALPNPDDFKQLMCTRPGAEGSSLRGVGSATICDEFEPCPVNGRAIAIYFPLRNQTHTLVPSNLASVDAVLPKYDAAFCLPPEVLTQEYVEFVDTLALNKSFAAHVNQVLASKQSRGLPSSAGAVEAWATVFQGYVRLASRSSASFSLGVTEDARFVLTERPRRTASASR